MFLNFFINYKLFIITGLLPEAIETMCDKCTKIQKSNARKVLKYMRENRPDIWDLFVEKYDPTGKYLKNFETFINEMDDSPSFF